MNYSALESSKLFCAAYLIFIFGIWKNGHLAGVGSGTGGSFRQSTAATGGAMAALGIGEIHHDGPGEGDGCDRCGFPDEEECCPAFCEVFKVMPMPNP